MHAVTIGASLYASAQMELLGVPIPPAPNDCAEAARRFLEYPSLHANVRFGRLMYIAQQLERDAQT